MGGPDDNDNNIFLILRYLSLNYLDSKIQEICSLLNLLPTQLLRYPVIKCLCKFFP